MDFVIQWLVCLVAFVAGSAVAYGVVSLIRVFRGARRQTAPAPDTEELSKPKSTPDPEPDLVEHVEMQVPHPAPKHSEQEVFEHESELEKSESRWPGPPSAWPGIGANR